MGRGREGRGGGTGRRVTSDDGRVRRGCRHALLAGVFVSVLTLHGASAQELTEQDAVARMRLEHASVRALDLSVRAREAEARERSLLSNPTVSYTREDAGSTLDEFLLVTQVVPLRGRSRLFGRAADQTAQAEAARADAARLAIVTRVRLAFTDLLLAQERSLALGAGLEGLNDLVEVLRTREEGGEGSRFDRLRAEREVADLEADLVTSTVERLGAQARLASFFSPGTDPGGLKATGSLVSPTPVPPLDDLLARARERRPDHRALVLDTDRWDTERQAAERLRLPTTSVSAGYLRSGIPGTRASGYAITANVGVPLFNRGQQQVARAEATRARLVAEREGLTARIDGEVRVARTAAAEFATLATRYRDRALDRATQLMAIASAAYEEGEYGILELLDAHRVRLDAELRWLDLLAAAGRAAIRLDEAVGEEVTQ